MALSRVRPRQRAMFMAALPLPLAMMMACGGEPPELVLDIRVPADDQGLFEPVTELNITATRDGVVLAQGSFPASASAVSLTAVSHGPRTVIALEGVDHSGQVIARGRTCELEFEGPETTAPLYFSPTNFFAPTFGAPNVVRRAPVGSALSDGTVLILGGANDDGTVVASGEVFSPGIATFAAVSGALARARVRAESILVPNVGLLVVGGLDNAGSVIAEAELFLQAKRQLVSVVDPRLDGRVGHRLVLLPDGRALVIGGTSGAGTAPLATTIALSVGDDGTYQASQGPSLLEARRDHAATVAVGIPIVFGGIGAGGEALDSIEVLDLYTGNVHRIGSLRRQRARATATVLGDGSVLLVGGVGSQGEALDDAEVFNPVTRLTTPYPLASPRRGHSATLLRDGRVMIAGGSNRDGVPVDDVELFAIDVGFLSERRLGTPRSGHLAVPLCDDTVLLVGGGPGAELYTGTGR